VTILDGNTDYENTKFFCYVGDNVRKDGDKYYLTSYESSTSNQYSSIYQFYSTDIFNLDSGYSNFISANQPFVDPPTVKITVDNQNLKEYSVTAQIAEFDYKVPSNPELFT